MQGGNEAVIGKLGDNAKVLSDDIHMQEMVVKNTEFETRTSRQEHERALDVHSRREKKLVEYADRKTLMKAAALDTFC